jgi:hypothetical protein
MCTGSVCHKKKKKPVVIPPNWEIWSDPGTVLALDETDPSGDDMGYGTTADLSLLQGTYDDLFVYIHLDVYSSPVLDMTGDTLYGLVIDADDSGDTNPGDWILAWDGLDGFIAWDYDGNPVGGFWCQVNPAGGLDFAIPRHLVDQTSFGVSAGIMYWDGMDWQEGDEMPPYPTWAAFTF